MGERSITHSLIRRETGSVPPVGFMRHASEIHDVHAALQHLKMKYRNTFDYLTRPGNMYVCYATNSQRIYPRTRYFFLCCIWHKQNKIVTCEDQDEEISLNEMRINQVRDEPPEQITSAPLPIIEKAFKQWLHRRTLFEKVIIELRKTYFELKFSSWVEGIETKHGIIMHDQVIHVFTLDNVETKVAPNPKKFARLYRIISTKIEKFISQRPILQVFEVYRGLPNITWTLENEINYVFKNINNNDKIALVYTKEPGEIYKNPGIQYIQCENTETRRSYQFGGTGTETIRPRKTDQPEDVLRQLKQKIRDLLYFWPKMIKRPVSAQLHTPWTTLERLLNIVSAHM